MQVYTTKKWSFSFSFLPFFPIALCQDPHIQLNLRIRLYHLIYHLQVEAAPSEPLESPLESGVSEGFLVVATVVRACASHIRRTYIQQVSQHIQQHSELKLGFGISATKQGQQMQPVHNKHDNINRKV